MMVFEVHISTDMLLCGLLEAGKGSFDLKIMGESGNWEMSAKVQASQFERFEGGFVNSSGIFFSRSNKPFLAKAIGIFISEKLCLINNMRPSFIARDVVIVFSPGDLVLGI